MDARYGRETIRRIDRPLLRAVSGSRVAPLLGEGIVKDWLLGPVAIFPDRRPAVATLEYWIQIENRPWDLSPHNIDRMTGQTMDVVTGQPKAMVTLSSVVAGTAPRSMTMFNPLREGANVVDALILRRYKPPAKADGSDAWTVPDDRKVNPWDLNEHNPGESGTMGSIPGPVIECSVGDEVHVHFKNADARSKKTPQARTHSLHPHGFVFATTSDGAYPLTPPDPSQPIGVEAAIWGSGQFKQGDRVPPGGSFTYTWSTFGWPSTAGVWLYHDHSICDMDNVELGAIGIIVIHNTAEDAENDVDIRDPAKPNQADPALVPGGSPNGSPVMRRPFPLKPSPLVTAGALAQLGLPADHLHASDADDHNDDRHEVAVSLKVGPMVLELDKELTAFRRLLLPVYRTPPNKQLILQLYHSLKGAGMCINGRKYLGNTPTILSGTATKMRFGVVSMGSDTHTFHLHGHRWVIPGPSGTDHATIQMSPQSHPVSQFEDTRLLGPANSLVFTIDGQSGSFMRAGGPPDDASLGEWHMHCHVLNHMMTGMMGSLLIVKGGEVALALPTGVPCPPDSGPATSTTEVHLTTGSAFSPQNSMINVGDTATWKWDDNDQHSVTSDTGAWADSGVKSSPSAPFPTFSHTFTTPGTFPYHCVIHGGPGAGMSGTITVM